MNNNKWGNLSFLEQGFLAEFPRGSQGLRKLEKTAEYSLENIPSPDNNNNNTLVYLSNCSNSSKMELQNLPSTIDRKQLRESSFLSLIVHILHEPTIVILDNIDQTVDHFTAELYSPICTEKRRQCSRLLRSVIECPLSVKEELETLQVLESLRSVVECLYRGCSRESLPFGRILTSLQELLYRGFYFREGFNTFERLGGVFVLLDILFLDRRLRHSILEHFEQWCALRRVTIQLIERLIHHSTDVQLLFFRNRSLFEVLAENYSNEKNILVRNSIVASFQQLVKFQGGALACHDCGLVKLLTENAAKCHLTGDRKEELISNLELLSVLTKKSDQCRLDFLSTSGSVDMLLDLLNPHRKYSTFILNDHFNKLVDYRIYKAMSYCTWVGNVRCWPFIWATASKVISRKLPDAQLAPEVISANLEVPEVVRSSCRRVKQKALPIIFYILAILKLFYDKIERWRQDRKYRMIRACLILVYITLFFWYQMITFINDFDLIIFINDQIVNAIFLHMLSDYSLVRILKLGSEIFQNVIPKLYDVPEALERFRERDGCALLVDLLKYDCSSLIPKMKLQATYAICSLKDLENKPESQVERERLRELGAYWALLKVIEELRDSKYPKERIEKIKKALKYLQKL